ncbi:MAG: tetratricopeptide repeat protein, partial [Cyanothece sp. SIO2G6]|nr:tetratricopeptide repeat protein [Cyanothece sp. SIO2G6]
MLVPFNFTIPDDAPFVGLALGQYQKRLDNPSLDTASRLSLMRCWSQQFLSLGDYLLALEILEEAIALQPDNPFTLALHGFAQEQAGKTQQAIKTYQQVLDFLGDSHHPIVAELWYRQGTVRRTH